MSTPASPLNDQEFLALTSVLQRAPLLPAEVLGVQLIIAKLQPRPVEPAQPPTE